MKKLSKVLSVICALVLVASLGVTAFADDTIDSVDPGTATGDVELNATVNTPETTYSVNVAWNNLVFTYTPGTAPSGWNTTTHSYGTQAGVGDWSNDGSGSVVVTNHSNVPVTLAGAYVSKTGYENATENKETGVTVAYTNFDSTQLAAGTPINTNGIDGDNQDSAAVKVTGDPKKAIENVIAGTITVTISAVAAA